MLRNLRKKVLYNFSKYTNLGGLNFLFLVKREKNQKIEFGKSGVFNKKTKTLHDAHAGHMSRQEGKMFLNDKKKTAPRLCT